MRSKPCRDWPSIPDNRGVPAAKGARVRSVIIGFALGVLALQHTAALPSRVHCVVILALALLPWLSCIGLEAISACGRFPCTAAARAAGWLAAQACRRTEDSGAVVCGTRWVRAAAYSLSLALAGAAAGHAWAAWRAHIRLADALPLALEQQPLRLSGRVVGLPMKTASGLRFAFDIEGSEPPMPVSPRRVMLNWYRGKTALPELASGQRLILSARLKRVHGDANFLGRDNEAAQLQRGIRATGTVMARPAPRAMDGAPDAGIRPRLLSRIDLLRGEVARRIEAALGDAPHRGVVTALAIGTQWSVDAGDWRRFSRTGTQHLVAISGLHLGLAAASAALVGGFCWRLLAYTPLRAPLLCPVQRIASVVGLAGATAFLALSGFGIPAQRAFWMVAIACFAFASGRRLGASYVLSWALACVLLVDPWAVISPGFWLSFAAVAAILYAVRASPGRAPRKLRDEAGEVDEVGKVGGVGDAGGPADRDAASACGCIFTLFGRLRIRLMAAARVQLAVTFALAPLTVLWFSQFSVISPLANAFAIPWVSLLVVPAVLFGLLAPAPLAPLAFSAAHHLLVVLARVLECLATPRWALLDVAAPGLGALACAGIAIGLWFLPRARARPRRSCLCSLLCLLPLFLSRPERPAPGEFRITALDVGQGGAVLVETALHRLLFDTGAPAGASDAGARVVVPYLRAHGIATLDTLLISHDHDDHYGGAASVMESLRVSRLAGSLPPTHGLWKLARAQGAAVGLCQAGQRWRWDGVDFAIHWPPPGQPLAQANASSCVLRVSNGWHAAVLPGDLEAAQELRLSAEHGESLDANILLAPHHGSRTSSSQPFLASIDPDHVVIQAGYLNRHRHPHASTLERYRARGMRIHRNDEHGAVRFETHGASLSVLRYREAHRRYWMGR